MADELPTQEKKERIASAAYRLFLQKGYKATSMADIAQLSGFSKSLVQKHFKKKEAFIVGFLEALLNGIDESLTSRGLKTDNYWSNLYLIGQLHYAFLLEDDGKRQLLMDIISNRQLTEAMIELDVNWAFQYMHSFSEDEKEALLDNMAIAMGGTYELLYRMLGQGRAIDLATFQRTSLSLTMYLQGMSPEDADAVFGVQSLSEDDIAEVLAFLNESFGNE